MADQIGDDEFEGINHTWKKADDMTNVIESAKANYNRIMGAALGAGVSTVISGLWAEKSAGFTVAAGLFTVAIPVLFFVGTTRRNRLFDEIGEELDRRKALRKASQEK
jgi:hypothetical protein